MASEPGFADTLRFAGEPGPTVPVAGVTASQDVEPALAVKVVLPVLEMAMFWGEGTEPFKAKLNDNCGKLEDMVAPPMFKAMGIVSGELETPGDVMLIAPA